MPNSEDEPGGDVYVASLESRDWWFQDRSCLAIRPVSVPGWGPAGRGGFPRRGLQREASNIGRLQR